MAKVHEDKGGLRTGEKVAVGGLAASLASSLLRKMPQEVMYHGVLKGFLQCIANAGKHARHPVARVFSAGLLHLPALYLIAEDTLKQRQDTETVSLSPEVKGMEDITVRNSQIRALSSTTAMTCGAMSGTLLGLGHNVAAAKTKTLAVILGIATFSFYMGKELPDQNTKRQMDIAARQSHIDEGLDRLGVVDKPTFMTNLQQDLGINPADLTGKSDAAEKSLLFAGALGAFCLGSFLQVMRTKGARPLIEVTKASKVPGLSLAFSLSSLVAWRRLEKSHLVDIDDSHIKMQKALATLEENPDHVSQVGSGTLFKEPAPADTIAIEDHAIRHGVQIARTAIGPMAAGQIGHGLFSGVYPVDSLFPKVARGVRNLAYLIAVGENYFARGGSKAMLSRISSTEDYTRVVSSISEALSGGDFFAYGANTKRAQQPPAPPSSSIEAAQGAHPVIQRGISVEETVFGIGGK